MMNYSWMKSRLMILILVATLKRGNAARGIRGYICQSDTRKINCRNNLVIDIKNASYGRDENSGNTCGVASTTEYCSVPATDVIHGVCGCKKNCSISVTNSLVSNANECPIPGKQLLITYSCIQKDDCIPSTLSTTIFTSAPTTHDHDLLPVQLWIPIVTVVVVSFIAIFILLLICMNKKKKLRASQQKTNKKNELSNGSSTVPVALSNEHTYDIILDEEGCVHHDYDSVTVSQEVAHQSHNIPQDDATSFDQEVNIENEHVYDTVNFH